MTLKHTFLASMYKLYRPLLHTNSYLASKGEAASSLCPDTEEQAGGMVHFQLLFSTCHVH